MNKFVSDCPPSFLLLKYELFVFNMFGDFSSPSFIIVIICLLLKRVHLHYFRIKKNTSPFVVRLRLRPKSTVSSETKTVFEFSLSGQYVFSRHPGVDLQVLQGDEG